MKKIMIAVLVGMVSAVLVAPASAAPTSTSALYGEAQFAPTCIDSSQVLSSKYGRVNVKATKIAGNNSFGTLGVATSVNGLSPRTTYSVVVLHLTVIEGSVVGCSQLRIGTFRTNGAGSGRFCGTHPFGVGDHDLAVMVTERFDPGPGIPFGQNVLVTNQLRLTVPAGA